MVFIPCNGRFLFLNNFLFALPQYFELVANYKGLDNSLSTPIRSNMEGTNRGE
jgi:hypothetical protein